MELRAHAQASFPLPQLAIKERWNQCNFTDCITSAKFSLHDTFSPKPVTLVSLSLCVLVSFLLSEWMLLELCLLCVCVVCPLSRSPWWRGGHVAQVLSVWRHLAFAPVSISFIYVCNLYIILWLCATKWARSFLSSLLVPYMFYMFHSAIIYHCLCNIASLTTPGLFVLAWGYGSHQSTWVS